MEIVPSAICCATEVHEMFSPTIDFGVIIAGGLNRRHAAIGMEYIRSMSVGRGTHQIQFTWIQFHVLLACCWINWSRPFLIFNLIEASDVA